MNAMRMLASRAPAITSRYLRLRLTANTNSSSMANDKTVLRMILFISCCISMEMSLTARAEKLSGKDSSNWVIFSFTAVQAATVLAPFCGKTVMFMVFRPLSL